LAKTRNKTHSEVESMRGYVRELEKEIRSLRQLLRQYEKYEQRSQDEEINGDSEDTHVEMKLTKDCDSCGKSKLVETLNLGHRGVFGQCSHCGFHGRIK
jgi:predicted RNA-binding Zn-ribbon protein involved in translation (DUF1610 family)